MRDYPPEYDDYCVVEVKSDKIPDTIDAYWDENGLVFCILKHAECAEAATVTLGNAEDEDEARALVESWFKS